MNTGKMYLGFINVDFITIVIFYCCVDIFGIIGPKDLSYTMECEPEEWECIQLEQYIAQEKDPELKEALEDLDEFLCG